MGINDWLRHNFGVRPPQRETSVGVSTTGPAPSPAPQPPKPKFKYVDLGGGWDRNVVGTHHFESVVESLPLGPLKVTLRHKPNPDNPHAIATFVGRQQVGWLSTDWSATDPEVAWVKQLESIGVRPRFVGECKLSEVRGVRKVVFLMPGRDDEPLDAIARRLAGEA